MFCFLTDAFLKEWWDVKILTCTEWKTTSGFCSGCSRGSISGWVCFSFSKLECWSDSCLLIRSRGPTKLEYTWARWKGKKIPIMIIEQFSLKRQGKQEVRVKGRRILCFNNLKQNLTIFLKINGRKHMFHHHF